MINWKKVLLSGCALVLSCGLLAGCMSNGALPSATSTPVPKDELQPEDLNDQSEFYTETSQAYRDLYAENAIERYFAQDFAEAMDAVDFDKLATAYLKAWQDEFTALYTLLDKNASDDDTRMELQGLYDYTVESSQAAYEENKNTYFYTDADGKEQSGETPEYLALFAQAEFYKVNTVLMSLNDYTGDTPYVFAFDKTR